MSLEIRQQIKIKGSTLSEDPVLYFDNTGSGESLASITVDSFGGGSSGELIFNYAQTNVLTESFRINQSGNLAMASSGNKIISNAIDPRANAIYNIGATGNSYANIYSQYLWADQSIKLGFSGFGNISASNGTGAGVIINGPGSGANDSMMKLQTELFYKGLIIQDSEISGVTRIDASAILELNSPTRGFRPPRNPDPVTNIVSPTNGLMAYDSTDDELQYYNGTSWVSLNDTAGAFLPLAGGTMSGDIDMDGNAIDFGGILGSITNPVGILTIQSNKNTTIDANGNTYDFSDGPPVITITGNGMTPGSLVMDASDGTIQATVSAIENILDLSTLPTANRYWEMPDADGTVALTSELGDYLPLAGGTMVGNITSLNISVTDGNYIEWNTGVAGSRLTSGITTGLQLWELPDATGTIALTSDIPSLAGYALVGTYTDGYVPRWNSTANTLESGVLRDDGTSLSKGIAPFSTFDFYMYSARTGAGENIGIYNIVSGAGTNANIALRGDASQSTGDNIGVEGRAGAGVSIGGNQNIAVKGDAGHATGLSYSFYGWNAGSSSGDNIGMYIDASNAGAGNAYALELIDGSEGTAGHFLKSMTTSGKANWAALTEADISDLGSYLPLAGGTMTGTIDMVAESIAFNDPATTYIQWDNSIGDYLRFANTGNDGFYFGDPSGPNGVEISDNMILISSSAGNPLLRFENTTAVGTCTIRPETTTASRTITLPDETGTVALVGNDVATVGNGIPLLTSVSRWNFTTNGTNTSTLNNGVQGQRILIVYAAEGAGTDSMVITPTTLHGYSTLTFNDIGDTVELKYDTTYGWSIISTFNTTIV